jgi:hypothetical protein
VQGDTLTAGRLAPAPLGNLFAGQKRTYTFVPGAVHTLQRVQSEWNERIRAFPSRAGPYAYVRFRQRTGRT